MAGVDLPVLPILLVVVGLQILYSVLIPRRVTR